MKAKFTPQKIITQYIETCDILKETTLNGDYKRGNKEGKKIIKVFKFLKKNLDVAEESLPNLLTHSNPVTRTKAAGHCLALGIRVDESIKTLEEAANDDATGIFGFNAKMTLKVWREQGYLIIAKLQ